MKLKMSEEEERGATYCAGKKERARVEPTTCDAMYNIRP